jgi:Tfp pilus assembly protein PilF
MSAVTAAVFKQAVLHHREGRYFEAERLYRQVLVSDPNQPDAIHNLGAALAQQGKLIDALPYLRIALKLNPAQPKYWSVCFETLMALKALPEAAALCQQLIALQPLSAAAYHNLGNVLKEMREWKRSADSYRAALRLKPNSAPTHNNLGNVLKFDNLVEEAVDSYRAALAISPEMVEAHFNLGGALEELGRLHEAETCYLNVLRLKPNYPDIERHLGAILCEQGRTPEALNAFLRHATAKYGSMGYSGSISPQQERHDAEQCNYLGIASTDIFRLEGGERIAGGAINTSNDTHTIVETWRSRNPKLVVIDNFLTGSALAEIRRLCLGSTFWRQSFPGGYLGTSPEFGFAAPVLSQIGEELSAVYTGIFQNHPLLQLWAFKYDSGMTGVNPHADFAAINVNFWITQDEANLDPGSGGLIIWDKAAPLDWDFAKYNTDEKAIRGFLTDAAAKRIIVPYRANRAVIFDSDLFHETDRYFFKRGYKNRRINVTYLYGWRCGDRGRADGR